MPTDPDYTWHGEHGKGAMRAYREEKRTAALARQAACDAGRCTSPRCPGRGRVRPTPEEKLVEEIFTEPQTEAAKPRTKTSAKERRIRERERRASRDRS